MLFILMMLAAYIVAFATFAIIYKKFSRTTLISYLVVGTFYFGVIIFYFFMGKYGGNTDLLLFPDEHTYLYNTYDLGLFGIYTKMLYAIGGITFVKMMNLFLFILGLLVICESVEIFNNKHKLWLSIYFIIGLSLFSYWIFFVLKEALTFSGLAFYLSYCINQKRKKLLMASLLILFITRLNLFAIIILIEVLYKISKKSKFFFLFSTFSVSAFTVWFLSSTYSFSFKLGILARRFGAANKQFDADARRVAQEGFFGFIFSQEYWQAILTSTLESFYPLMGNSIWTSLLILFNLSSILLIFFYFKPKKDLPFFLFISIIALLLSTNSSFRYINAIIIPFVMYFSTRKGVTMKH